mmetsp:Transcript_4732/g.8545  ORF Transcript_4732/g.8545 Transcript_4732/m.8545 type:complete len:106 (-) Transcript_4732:73-390(-)
MVDAHNSHLASVAPDNGGNVEPATEDDHDAGPVAEPGQAGSRSRRKSKRQRDRARRQALVPEGEGARAARAARARDYARCTASQDDQGAEPGAMLALAVERWVLL